MKLLSLLSSFFFSACATVHPTSVKELSDVTVKILSNGGGGGTGVIYKSTPDGSVILTNAHICEAISTGGSVNTDRHYEIKYYKISTKHDICYVMIKENLHVNTVLASSAPKRHSAAVISGHPSLYPHVVSKGYISGNRNIGVTVEHRACTKEEELEDPVTCIFEGASVIKRRESTLVSALISPGSSGSGVFNSKGELIGLAFAASGEINYAQTVPWKYLKEFVEKDAKTLKWETPGPDKKKAEYENEGMEDLENWRKLFDLIQKRDKCLKFCP